MKMDSASPLFTVIVPAYNVEKYIGECLDSFLRQTDPDFKVLIVNDGATDSTGEIAKTYAAAYPDVFQYVEQENRGLGAARNVGLALVDTLYVGFLDSDDWLDCFFFEKVKRELTWQKEPVDIFFTLPWIYDMVSRQIQPWNDKDLLERLFYAQGDAEDVPSRVMNIDAEFGLQLYDLEASSCRCIFRTAFLKQIGFRFSEGLKWEDVQPHFLAIHHAKRCVGVKSTGFFYRVNSGGQITSGNGASRLDIIPVFENTFHMAAEAGWSDSEIAHIAKMLCSFSNWSIGITNCEYIDLLLKQLHVFFHTIPSKYFRLFLQQDSGHCLRERILIWMLRSPFYGILGDYRFRERAAVCLNRVRNLMNKLRRR